jgi:hypothetical protein
MNQFGKGLLVGVLFAGTIAVVMGQGGGTQPSQPRPTAPSPPPVPVAPAPHVLAGVTGRSAIANYDKFMINREDLLMSVYSDQTGDAQNPVAWTVWIKAPNNTVGHFKVELHNFYSDEELRSLRTTWGNNPALLRDAQ